MAASLNKVFIMGNLTRDPELRYIPSGSAVANFTVAVNRIYKDNAGQKKEDVSFIRVVVWGKMAEICGEYLTKGRPVLVEGRLKSRTWEAQDGQKRNALDVVATSVQFLGAKSDRDKKQADAPDVAAGYPEVEDIDVEKEAAEGEVPF
ncbi:MAG: single-stranded DNA-binding protein [Candidatus Omnitrophica bacterium]|nr:single-stranded DNA-binding protein [Candidatus Omnitrophota bacterium]